MTANPWPGPHEKQVIAEMLENRDSEHWTKCSELMKWLILKETGKYSPPISADLVDEIWQNAMLSIITGLPHFRSESKLTTWLTKIAYTRTIDALRASSRDSQMIPLQNHSTEDEEKEAIPYKHKMIGTLEEECITNEELREVLAEISAYIGSHAKPERNRKIVRMVIFEGRTLEEAAKEVGVSSAVASYVIRNLRQHLHKKNKDNPSST